MTRIREEEEAAEFVDAGDDDEMFMTRSLNATPKATEQHLIARSDNSVAYVTNNTLLDVLYY